MIRALPHLLQRARRAWALHCLRCRRAQLLQGLDTLDRCMAQDRTMFAKMVAELADVDARFATQAGQAEPAALFRSPL